MSVSEDSTVRGWGSAMLPPKGLGGVTSSVSQVEKDWKKDAKGTNMNQHFFHKKAFFKIRSANHLENKEDIAKKITPELVAMLPGTSSSNLGLKAVYAKNSQSICSKTIYIYNHMILYACTRIYM